MPKPSEAPAPPRKRPQYHHGDLAAAIKQAAVERIAEHGVEGFSLREAAEVVGVSPSAAYRHFADKADLLRAIARDAFAEMARRFAHCMDRAQARVGDDPRLVAIARFRAQGRAYVQFAIEDPARLRIMFGPFGAGAPGGAWRPGDSEAGPYAMLGKALDDLHCAGVMSGRTRPDAEITAWAAVHGLASLLVANAIAGATQARVAAMTRRVIDDVLAALGAGAPSPADQGASPRVSSRGIVSARKS